MSRSEAKSTDRVLIESLGPVVRVLLLVKPIRESVVLPLPK